MISDWLSAALARRNIHYGWVVVAATFLTVLISAGALGAPGVFIVPLQNEFGWSTARDLLGAVDPLHPVRADGAVRRRPVESLRPAQCDAVVVAGGRPPASSRRCS